MDMSLTHPISEAGGAGGDQARSMEENQIVIITVT